MAASNNKQKKKYSNEFNNYFNQYYQYSSEAVEIAPNDEYLDGEIEFDQLPISPKRITKRKKRLTGKARRKAILKRTQPKYLVQKDSNKKVGVGKILSAIVLFSCIFSYLYIFSLNSVATVELGQMQKELKTLEDSNKSFKMEMLSNYDLNEINLVATTKLGMTPPEEHQKIYINAPKQNYYVQYDAELPQQQQEYGFAAMLKLLFNTTD